MTMETYDPDFSLYLALGGANETEVLKENITRSRNKRLDYANSGTTTYPTSHTEAYLEDYSIDLYSEINNQSTGEYVQFNFGDDDYDDVFLGRTQEFHERFRLHKRFRAPRIRVTNKRAKQHRREV